MGEETAVVPAAREKGEGQVSEPRDGAKPNAALAKGATALAVVLVAAGLAASVLAMSS